MVKEVVKFTDGNGKLLSEVFQTDAGFVIMSPRWALNRVVKQQYVAEEIARIEAERRVA